MNEQQQGRALKELEDWGCDVQGALNRLLNSRDFYFKLRPSALTDPSFDAFGEALREKDVKAAFESAHTLKGVLGNLGLTPMYKETCSAVELLRNGILEGVEPHYSALMELRTVLDKIIGENAR